MLPYLEAEFANPASIHRAGQRARQAVDGARDRVAAAIGASSGRIVFTSGATEADNLAVRAALAATSGGHLVTSALEHPAVLEAARQLGRLGVEVSLVEPDDRGVITEPALRRALRSDTTLVALMLVNNETGIRTDIARLTAVAHEAGVPLFCDAVQGFGCEPISVSHWGVDALSLSGHKVFGPKGVGVLYLGDGFELAPILFGGGQEGGLRPGTVNTAAVVGMGVAGRTCVDASRRWRHRPFKGPVRSAGPFVGEGSKSTALEPIAVPNTRTSSSSTWTGRR